MKKQDIHIGDWSRLFLGEVQGAFYIELVFRAIVVYALILISMRLMGKRMSGLMNRNELAALASIAASVGVPLGQPDRGIVPAFVVAAIVIVVENTVSLLAFKSRTFEWYALGHIDTLLSDGIIDMKILKKIRITRERLFAQLRCEGIKNLGEVKKLYMEATGSFTVLKSESPGPGLSVIPYWDEEYKATQKVVNDIMACENCGFMKPAPASGKCPNCGREVWTNPVIE